MKTFELPKFDLPKFDPTEAAGTMLGKVLKGAGVDLAQLGPIAQAMLAELQAVKAQLDRIEAMQQRIEACEEVLRYAVPGAAEMFASIARTDAASVNGTGGEDAG